MAKNIDPIYIATTLLLPKIGRKTAFKIFNNLSFKISGFNELYDYLEECRAELRTPEVYKSDFERATNYIEEIINKNEKESIKMISYYDSNFPNRFIIEKDSPILLHCKGNTALLNHEINIGIIGTREPLENAFKLGVNASAFFAERGFNIVSGLAIGCDTSGHLGALKVNGLTTAILAHGLHTVYPKENIELANRILDNNGLLLSEYIIGTSALPNYFVERDRLQSYLSDCLCIVQTDIKGGTMHAVKVAYDTGKKIAVIYPEMEEFIKHNKSRGNEFIIDTMNGFQIENLESLNILYQSIIKKEIDNVKPQILMAENKMLKKNKNSNNQFDIPFN